MFNKNLPTKILMAGALLLAPGFTSCEGTGPNNPGTQSASTTRMEGEIVLPYAASDQSSFQTQQVTVTTTIDPDVRLSVDELYRLEAVIDGEVRTVNVTNVRVDPITGQTYIVYDVENIPTFGADSVVEIRTVNGYWLGGSLVTYRPGVIVVDITPATSLDMVLAREGTIPGGMKIGDLSRRELWVLGFDPDSLNANASIRSIVKGNGQVKANKLRKNGNGNGNGRNR